MQTRRTFLRSAGAAGALVLVPPALAGGQARERRLLRGGRFAQGVVSGEPTPRSIVLATNVAEVTGSGTVQLEVARDRGFRRVIARERVRTSAALGHSVKARVAGLRPHEEYFYRFATTGSESPVGRFRTALPADSRAPVRFAFFSCQDYRDGLYNAHALLAREDVDFVVNLGDYIYESSGGGVRTDPTGTEAGGRRQAITLDDYRAKYALYRSDPDLQAMHANAAMIALWDDHEVQNNYAGGEPDGGLAADRLYSTARRRAAYRAYFEAMPLFARDRTRIYRSLRFGRTVEIVVMDQRQYRADQPCGDAIAPACADWDRPRDFLGRRQMGWVKDRLSRSPAAWKVMANELMAMPLRLPGGAYATFDSWQGYPREREELLQHLRRERIRDVVFLTGDIHCFFAGDVRTQMGAGETVALEFVGGSISSPGLGSGQAARDLAEAARGVNPYIDQADLENNGYGIIRASQRELDVRLRRMATITERSTATLPEDAWRYRVRRGQRSIVG